MDLCRVSFLLKMDYLLLLVSRMLYASLLLKCISCFPSSLTDAKYILAFSYLNCCDDIHMLFYICIGIQIMSLAPRLLVSSTVASSHIWLFKLRCKLFKLNEVKNSVPQSQSHISCVASGYCIWTAHIQISVIAKTSKNGLKAENFFLICIPYNKTQSQLFFF